MKRLLIVIWSLTFLLPLGASDLIPDINPFMVEVEGTNAILINAETGAILYAKKANEHVYPASATKVATALYAYSKLKNRLDEKVAIEHSMIGTITTEKREKSGFTVPTHWIEIGGTHIGLKKDEEMSVKDLFMGLLIVSGNDAANALALASSGSYNQFNLGLNEYLTKIGCRGTHFNNAHGHFHPEHFTTVYDLAVMGRELMNHDFLRDIVGRSYFSRPATNKQKEIALAQSNRLLRKGKYYYSKATGIKTGGGTKGRTLVASAEDENRKLVAVISGVEGRSSKVVFEDTIKLFEAAFSEEVEERVLVPKGVTHFTRKIKGGNQDLKTEVKEDLSLRVYPSEEEKVKGKVVWESLVPPVKKGQRVGKVIIENSSHQIIKEAGLFASHDINPTMRFEMMHTASRSPMKFWGLLSLFLLSILSFITLIFRRK